MEFNVVVEQLAADAAIGIAPDTDLIADTRHALAAFMNARAVRQQPLDRQAVVVDELRARLREVTNQEATLIVRDADGDQQLDLLVALPLSGLPAFVVRHQPDGFVGYQAPRPAGWATNGPVTFERVEDLNADGIPEIVLTSRILTHNAAHTLVSIARWNGEAFALLLQTGIRGRSDPAGWEFVEQKERQVLVTRCPARGVYDDDRLPHLTLTRVFDWEDGGLVLTQVVLDPPETLRQQVNSAEAAFRQGRLERALAAFRAIPDTAGMVDTADLSVETDTVAVDWRAYAQFRIGELEAIRGNAEAARTAMQRVQAAGSTIGPLATAFLDGYSADDPVRALANLQHVNLAERMQAPDANLGFPMNARDILYPGAVVAAHLNAVPDAARGSGEVLTTSLRDLGLDAAGSAIVDLDGDRHPEVITVINEQVGSDVAVGGQIQTLWLVSRKGGEWWAQPLESAPEVVLTATVPAPEQGRRAVIYQLSNGFARAAAIGWDGSQVQRYDAPDGDELAPQLDSDAMFDCQVP